MWLEQSEGGGGGAGDEVRRVVSGLRLAGLSAMASNLNFIPKYTEELLEGFRQGNQWGEMIRVQPALNTHCCKWLTCVCFW